MNKRYQSKKRWIFLAGLPVLFWQVLQICMLHTSDAGPSEINIGEDSRQVLIQKKHFIYKGAFRVPKGKYGPTKRAASLASGGAAIAYNESRNSLYITGHPWERMILEMSIPAIVETSDIKKLHTAKVLQPSIDITGGNWDHLKEDGSRVGNGGSPGGFLLYKDRLIGSAYAFYDGDYSGSRSHFIASPDWATEGIQFHGMFKVGIHPTGEKKVNGGFVGGYMAHIPDSWQEALGGPVLTGKGSLAIITRTSLGPCAWVFDPNDLGVIDPAPAVMLVGYPAEHSTLGSYGGTSLLYNMVTQINGIVFPEGSASILFFGRHGLGITGKGDTCYGMGTDDPNIHGRPHPDGGGNKWCYDPAYGDKGVHGYPYIYQVWAYDVRELVKVKDKTINTKTGRPHKPWDVLPYAVWEMDLPYAVPKAEIAGAAYDVERQRIFISQRGSDRYGLDPFPIIHVFEVNMKNGD